MSKRDPVADVLEVKTREGRRAAWFPPGAAPIDELANLWRSRMEQFVSIADFFPTRLVTLIEVFTRRWLERLIDHGQPYLGNAGERAAVKLWVSSLLTASLSTGWSR